MWESVYAYHYNSRGPREKTFLPFREPRTCRFCNGAIPTVSFSQRCHIIPAAFGNRTLFSHEECDNCNIRGSNFENDLVGFLALERALAGQRTRRGGTKYRLLPERSYISSRVSSKVSDIVTYRGDRSIKASLVEENTLSVSVELPPHCLNGVAKALVRMALFVIPSDQLQQCAHLIGWLDNEIEWAPVFYKTFFLRCWLDKIGLWVEYNASTQIFRTYFGFTNSLLLIDFPAFKLPSSDLRLPPMADTADWTLKAYHAPATRIAIKGRRKTIELSFDRGIER